MKKNILTDKEANQILKRLKKTAKPSERLKKYVHNVLLDDAHILFQYKIGSTRYGYCTGCGNDFPIEINKMRTYTDNDIDVLQAKHNEKVICPCCGRTVTKRYAGFSRKNMYANAAEFKVDKSGALIVYVYRFTYRFSDNFRNEREWHCWQIGYFDLHKYFHLLYRWGNDSFAYTGDRYTNELLFTNEQKVELPFEWSQSIKCFELQKAVKKSNLKYACLDKYMNGYSVTDLFRYLKFYCSYPEITEKLMKEGYKDDITQYLFGNLSGCFNVRAKNVLAFFKLDKVHLKTLHEYKHCYGRDEIRAMQYMQNNGIKLTYGVFNFISSNYRNIASIHRLRSFMGMQKLIKYVGKQGALCGCQHYYGTIENLFFSNYKDYISQCEQLGYDLTDKNIAVPMNLFQAHQQLTDLLNAQKLEAEKKTQAEKMKKLKKRLTKLKEKYCYTDGSLLIRPAESYKDLQKEGTALHHCVYSVYRDRYINGETDILFIRRVSEPDKPFYTMEYKNGNVVQCRTAYNGGMTDEVKAFIDKWKAFIKSNNKKKKKEAA